MTPHYEVPRQGSDTLALNVAARGVQLVENRRVGSEGPVSLRYSAPFRRELHIGLRARNGDAAVPRPAVLEDGRFCVKSGLACGNSKFHKGAVVGDHATVRFRMLTLPLVLAQSLCDSLGGFPAAEGRVDRLVRAGYGGGDHAAQRLRAPRERILRNDALDAASFPIGGAPAGGHPEART